jgi:SAM-dependent methyltransferase
MKPGFAEALRCPACRREHALRLHSTAGDGREVREGTLRCRRCGTEFAVRRGVPELLYRPPAHVLAEAAGLERFAERMRATGWDRDFIRRLPLVDHGYWYVQARSMHQLLTTIPFQPGQSILDVGSNTCWAANHFAERGLRAVALDITTAELQGLYTADYFLEGGDVFFERVLGSMDAIPLASSSVDYVYCCEVLHHNDEDSLRRTMTEIFRVLRPGGRLLMVNETLKTLRDPHGVHVEDVAQFEGYEHAHWAWQYRWAATRAGFYTDVTEPHYRPFFGDAELELPADVTRPQALARRAGFALRHSRLARRAYLAWLNHAWGDVSMNLIATKPSRYVVRHRPLPTPVRLALMAAAGLRLRWARARGRGAPALPRTPEQAASRISGWMRSSAQDAPAIAAPAANGAATGSRPRAARCD